MSWQESPLPLQRRHSNLNDIGVSPAQEPVEAVSVEPLSAWPEMLGRSVFEGGCAERAAPPLPATNADAARQRTSVRISRVMGRVFPPRPRYHAAHLQRLRKSSVSETGSSYRY